MTFNQEYFQSLYAKGETIDGDFNAKDHAKYLKSLFDLIGYHPTSIYDFGFGKGNLLRAMAKTLECTKVGGCDISKYALERLQNKAWAHDWTLINSEIHHLSAPKKPFHVGLCNSVLQYIPNANVEAAVRKMAQSCRYVYLHVPSHEDYKILKQDLAFTDSYALQRPNRFYYRIISEYFYFVAWGLVESKKFSNHKTSLFTDSLYRF